MLRKILSTAMVLVGTMLVLAGCAAPTSSSKPTPTPAPTPAHSGTPVWAQTATSGPPSQFLATAADDSGNVYAAGSISGSSSVASSTTDFGNGVTAVGASSGSNIVLVKYNASGTAQWAQTSSSTSSQSNFSAVTTDASGNVYAAGTIKGTGALSFGNGVTATGAYSGNSVLVVKYDASGTAQWARTLSSSTADTLFSAVAVDTSGNVYTAGYVTNSGNYAFGNGVIVAPLVSNGNSWMALVVKYDASGTAQWAQTAAGEMTQFFAIAVSGSDAVYVAGQVRGTDINDFGNSVAATGINADDVNLVLVKYNASGTAQWAQTPTTASTDTSTTSFSGLRTDSLGNVYAVGSIFGTATLAFGNGVTATGSFNVDDGEANIVLVKYNASGTAQWARTSSSNSAFSAVAVDSSDNIFAAGTFSVSGSTADFGSGVTAATTVENSVLLVKYNSSGTPQWARAAASGSSPFTGFAAVTADGSGHVYAAGKIWGKGTYGFGSGVTAAGPSSSGNIVLVKYQ